MIQFDQHRSWFEKLFRLLAAIGGLDRNRWMFEFKRHFPLVEINV